MRRNFHSHLESHWNRRMVQGILSLCLVCAFLVVPAFGQLGNSGSIEGVVKDPSGSSVAGATVEITNPISGFHRDAVTGTDGSFRFTNVPFNPYHMVVTAPGFSSFTQDVDVRSTVPTCVQIALKLGTANTSVTVEANGGDLRGKRVDLSHRRRSGNHRPAAARERVVLGDLAGHAGFAGRRGGLQRQHARAGRSRAELVFGRRPADHRSDQQSVSRTRFRSDSIQSLEVISGAPPAEFGDKTSLVIKVTTKSGLGVTKPTGSVHDLVRQLRHRQRGFRPRLRQSEMGKFHRRERIEERTLPRSAGIHADSRQRQRGKYL